MLSAFVILFLMGENTENGIQGKLTNLLSFSCNFLYFHFMCISE